MGKGYTGQILRVNLTNGKISVDTQSDTWYRTYFGGTGIIAYYLMKELEPGVDPLGPENKLIFATGPVVGAPLAGSGRNSVGAKSPLSGAIGFTEAGGFWGPELKRAGYDAIIIEGKADKPCYISIVDGKAEIRDAAQYWGKLAHEVEEGIKAELGDKGVRVTQCGIAGENQVKFACIVNDLTHFYGRTGMGAVMGSKNLRAVAVRGHHPVEVANKEKVAELAKWMVEKAPELAGSMTQYGTTGTILNLNAAGGLPTRNFTQGVFDGAENISGQHMNETILIERDSCFACPIKCKRVVKTGAPYNVDPKYGGPEYETLGAMGSTTGVSDLEVVAKGNELAAAYVLDSISTGMTIAFAMECYENGLLTKEQTDGVELKFGNGPAMLELITKIANREGLGNLLAEGSARAAAKIGHGADKCLGTVKGQEAPMHDPRLKMGLGIGYALSPTGADHCHNIHDTAYEKKVEGLGPWGILETMKATDLGPNKMQTLKVGTAWKILDNCVEICQFVPWTHEQIVEIVKAVTGWNTSLYELTKVGERAYVLARIFNLREGFSEREDTLPKKFLTPLKEGAIAGIAPTPQEVDRAKRDFYEMAGWDRWTGVPKRWKLEELNIAWAGDEYDRWNCAGG